MPSAREPSNPLTPLLGQLAHTGCGVMAVNAQQKIFPWNRAAERLLGCSARQALGRSCQRIVRCQMSDLAAGCSTNCSLIQMSRRRHWPSHQLLRIRHRDQPDGWLPGITFTLFSPPRKLSALVHVFWSAEETPRMTSAVPAAVAPARVASPRLWLTPRELQVLRHMAAGADTSSIARALFISPATVRIHAQRILKKLQVHSRLEAVALARQHRWA